MAEVDNRMTRLSATREVFERFPGMSIVVASAAGIRNTPNPAVVRYFEQAWASRRELDKSYERLQAHPNIAAWREAFRSALGISPGKFQSSVESLLRRNQKRSDPHFINPIVDFYNALSLRYLVPVGAFDLAEVCSDIELRLTKQGDVFTPLTGGEAVQVAEGEVAYADESTILTRHFVWRQAHQARISEKTTSAVFVAELLGSVDGRVGDSIEADLVKGFAELFGVKTHVGRIAADRRSIWVVPADSSDC